MRTAHRSRGDKDGVQYYAAELQIDGRTFGRVMITSPVDVAKIDAHWWDFKSYATAHHIVAHVQGRQLIEGRCNELSVGGGWVRGADPNVVNWFMARAGISMNDLLTNPVTQFWLGRATGVRLAGGETLTLLCSSACVDPARCHRTLLARLVTHVPQK